MKIRNILVLGAHGKTGRRVVSRLHAHSDIVVRAGSRQATPPFDWTDSSTWTSVLHGIDAVYVTFQPDLAVPDAPQLIEAFTIAATRSGVRKVVLLSGRGEPEARACEDIVRQHAVRWTVVRASWFNQNFSEGFFMDSIRSGAVALPRAETLEPFVDAGDIADVVVQCLLHDQHDGQVYELTGPRLLTFPQAIAEIAQAAQRNIQFQSISIDAYASALKQYDVPDDAIWLIRYLFTEVLDGRNASLTQDVERVLGRRPKDFSAYALEGAQHGVW